MNNSSTVADLRKLVSCYQRAVDQVRILDEEIRFLEVRLDRTDRCAIRTSLKIRLSVIENIRKAFYVYAQRKCEEFNRTRERNAFKMYRVTV